MKRKSFIGQKLAILLLLTGCSAVVTPEEVNNLNDACAHNGGLKYAEFTSFLDGVNDFYCTDGAIITLRNIDIRK